MFCPVCGMQKAASASSCSGPRMRSSSSRRWIGRLKRDNGFRARITLRSFVHVQLLQRCDYTTDADAYKLDAGLMKGREPLLSDYMQDGSFLSPLCVSVTRAALGRPGHLLMAAGSAF